MTDQDFQLINPNTADEAALIRLNGVGPALAARIVQGRPYTRAEDLLTVSGLGERLLAEIKPYLIFEEPQPAKKKREKPGETAADQETLKEKSKASDVVDETVNYLVHLPSIIREELKKKSGFNRRTTILIAIGTGVVSTFLSLFLMLTIMTMINGTLSVRRNAQVQSLAESVNQMEVQLEDLDSRLQAISGRVQAVEGLSGRITTVEESFQSVQSDIEQAVGQVETMQSNVDDLAAQVDSLAGSINTFDQFLARLFELLSQLEGSSQAN